MTMVLNLLLYRNWHSLHKHTVLMAGLVFHLLQLSSSLPSLLHRRGNINTAIVLLLLAPRLIMWSSDQSDGKDIAKMEENLLSYTHGKDLLPNP